MPAASPATWLYELGVACPRARRTRSGPGPPWPGPATNTASRSRSTIARLACAYTRLRPGHRAEVAEQPRLHVLGDAAVRAAAGCPSGRSGRPRGSSRPATRRRCAAARRRRAARGRHRARRASGRRSDRPLAGVVVGARVAAHAGRSSVMTKPPFRSSLLTSRQAHVRPDGGHHARDEAVGASLGQVDAIIPVHEHRLAVGPRKVGAVGPVPVGEELPRVRNRTPGCRLASSR